HLDDDPFFFDLVEQVPLRPKNDVFELLTLRIEWNHHLPATQYFVLIFETSEVLLAIRRTLPNTFQGLCLMTPDPKKILAACRNDLRYSPLNLMPTFFDQP